MQRLCPKPNARQRLVNWQEAPHARYVHPREEHLLPLQVCYGMGQSAGAQGLSGTGGGISDQRLPVALVLLLCCNTGRLYR